MKLEKLKPKNTKKKFIIGLASIAILSAGALTLTHAKYKTSESIEIANGTINYELADTNLIGVYIQNGEDYTKTDTIPEGYVLNEEESYCKVNNEVDNNISITYDTSSKTLSITPMTTKGTKCYLYFDTKPSAKDTLLAYYSDVQTRTNFSSRVTATTTGTIYKSANSSQYDDDGEVYYFAGNPTDNWVRFGGFYWRIVRVNGDGSVRLIYNGTSTATTGSGTMISSSQAFNSSYNRSEYVGLKYTTGQQHGQNTDSPILDTLQSWYSSSGLSATQYSQHIDTNVGFCSDRNMASGYSWSSQPSSTIYYAAYGRLDTNKSPSLACTSSDVIKEPVGLITADEVAFAGGGYRISNTSYYLYNNSYYWTMSPYHSSGRAGVFYVYSTGYLGSSVVFGSFGVRPVINLKADTKFQGSGTSTDPFTVN